MMDRCVNSPALASVRNKSSSDVGSFAIGNLISSARGFEIEVLALALATLPLGRRGSGGPFRQLASGTPRRLDSRVCFTERDDERIARVPNCGATIRPREDHVAVVCLMLVPARIADRAVGRMETSARS